MGGWGNGYPRGVSASLRDGWMGGGAGTMCDTRIALEGGEGKGKAKGEKANGGPRRGFGGLSGFLG